MIRDIHVIRRQWPVGQGCFASGQVSINGQVFEYVYDCGSNNVTALQSSVAALQPHNGIIDALFISHLDSDHVNGIDLLLSSQGYTIKTVFLPYIDPMTTVLILASDISKGVVTTTFTKLLSDPASWFGARGVSRIVYIGRSEWPSEDEDIEEPMPIDFQPDSQHNYEADTDERWSHEGRATVILSQSSKIKSPKSPDVAETIEVGARCQFAIGDGSWPPTWLLKPFVPPVNDYALAAFKGELKKLKILTRFGNLSNGTIQGILSDNTLRKQLKDSYQIFASNHNHVSMCLYSGPLGSPVIHKIYTGYSRDEPYWYEARHGGWMGTGDAPLKVGSIFNAFKHHYDGHLQEVDLLMCPHHGSSKNFNPALLTEMAPSLCFAAHGQCRPYGHPHHDVMSQIRGRGIDFVGVTENSKTGIVEHIRLT